MNRRVASRSLATSFGMLVLLASGPMSGTAAAAPTAHVAAQVSAACRVDPSIVMKVLGVSDRAKFAGPELLAGGACSWHSTDPNCYARSLAVRTFSAVPSSSPLSRVRPFDRAVHIATDAFYASDEFPPGVAIEIEHLTLPLGGGRWAEVTVSGRLGADRGRSLLDAVAREARRAGRPSGT